MHFPIIIILLVLPSITPLSAATARGPVREVVRSYFKPSAFQTPSPDINVTTYFALSKNAGHRSGSRSTPFLDALRKGKFGPGLVDPMRIGARSYNLLIDTGSSDTWLATNDVSCYNLDSGLVIPQAECAFGPLYTPGREFDAIDDVNFNIQYGDGAFLRGGYGMAKVTLGGITVKQQIAAAREAGWVGGGISSGLLGFAYPSLTFAFSETNYSADVPETQAPYNPIFTTMHKQKKIPPVFSLAISRPSVPPSNRPEGYLALGGLAPVATYGKWAKAPIEYVQIGPGYLNGSLPWPQYQWYVITPDAFLFNNATGNSAPSWKPLNTTGGPSTFQTMIDSGVTLNWLPTAIANHIASLFSPPAIWNEDVYGYSVPCTATAPQISIKINGVILAMHPRDLIIDDMSGKGTCISGVSDGGTYAPYVLGDVWLKRVLAVFDVGGGEVRVRSRGHY